MIRTIIPQQYYDETIVKTGKIYALCRNVTFNNDDNMIVAYLEKGAEIVTDVEHIEYSSTTDQFGVVSGIETVVIKKEITQKKLTVETVKYSNDTMKTLIDALGEVYNKDLSNNLVSETKRLADIFIQADISKNPQKYFGLTINKFEKVL